MTRLRLIVYPLAILGACVLSVAITTIGHITDDNVSTLIGLVCGGTCMLIAMAWVEG